MNLSQIKHYQARRARAKEVGFPLEFYQLGTTKDFVSRLPTEFILNRKRVPIKLLDEFSIRQIFMEVIIEDVYGLTLFNRPVKTVLDIGANIGIFCLAARSAFPDAVIHAYEPNRDLEPYLKVQADATGTTVFLEAVQQEEGFVTLIKSVDHSVETMSKADANGTIPAASFRTAMERMGGRVDFVKMDCEGAEWDILEDVEAWQGVQYLAMEYHGSEGRGGEEALQKVRNLGLEIVHHEVLPYDHMVVGIIKAQRK